MRRSRIGCERGSKQLRNEAGDAYKRCVAKGFDPAADPVVAEAIASSRQLHVDAA